MFTPVLLLIQVLEWNNLAGVREIMFSSSSPGRVDGEGVGSLAGALSVPVAAETGITSFE